MDGTEAFVLPSILHRMIFWELLKIFFISFTAITGIVLMGGLVAEASQQGLGPVQILAIIPLFIPSLLPYILPTSTLFATCVVYGRLAADNEILAIKAAGVNVMKVVWPALFLGLVMSCATMGLYYRVIPYTHYLMRTLFLNDVKEVLYGMLKKDKNINHPRLDFAMSVRDVQGRKLIDATFQHRARGERDKGGSAVHDIVIRAREAELDVDLAGQKLIVKMRDGEFWNHDNTFANFQYREEPVELPDLGVNSHALKPRDMSWQQMLASRQELLDRIAAFGREEAEGRQRLREPDPPRDLARHVNDLAEAQPVLWGGVQQIDAEFQMRPALSFGCLCFVLIGCPVGIWFSRSDYLSAFITCFLPIVFVYYPLMLCGTNFAKEGKFHAAADVWAADAVVALVGVVLFTRLLKN
jgi:lipopolysaccharide export system permease protein